MSMRSCLFCAAAFVAVLAGSVSASAAEDEVIQISQPGDGNLDCAQLAAEIGRMDQVIAQSQNAQSNANAAGTAAGVAGSAATHAALYSGAFGRVPGLGLFGGAIESAARSGAQRKAELAAQRAQNAQMRRVSLMGIYQGKACDYVPAAPVAPAASAASAAIPSSPVTPVPAPQTTNAPATAPVPEQTAPAL